MSIHLEAYTAAGIIKGEVAQDGRLGELLETCDAIGTSVTALVPIEGGAALDIGGQVIPTDELLIVVAPDDAFVPSHATWHDLQLRVGPYEIHAGLPTMPGFDPGRSLLRPSGTFTLLGRVRLRLAGRTDEPRRVAFAWVNRYAVERVAGDLDLGFFFPGAEAIRPPSGEIDDEDDVSVPSAHSTALRPTTSLSSGAQRGR